jgi:hypothetical protein
MKNIVLIIPNIFKRLLIFNYKLCQAPNYTTKKIKEYKWREREAQMCCVFLGDSSTPLFIYDSSRFGE